MSQATRIAIGTVVLAPIIAAFLLTGFPAAAAAPGAAPSLNDPRVESRIERLALQTCRSEIPGSIEHSVCLSEARKDAYREAARLRARPQDASFTSR